MQALALCDLVLMTPYRIAFINTFNNMHDGARANDPMLKLHDLRGDDDRAPWFIYMLDTLMVVDFCLHFLLGYPQGWSCFV